MWLGKCEHGAVARGVREEGAEVKEKRPLGQSLEQHRETVFISLNTVKVHSNRTRLHLAFLIMLHVWVVCSSLN